MRRAAGEERSGSGAWFSALANGGEESCNLPGFGEILLGDLESLNLS